MRREGRASDSARRATRAMSRKGGWGRGDEDDYYDDYDDDEAYDDDDEAYDDDDEAAGAGREALERAEDGERATTGARAAKTSKAMELMKTKPTPTRVGMKEIEARMAAERNARYPAAPRGPSGGGASAGKFAFDTPSPDAAAAAARARGSKSGASAAMETTETLVKEFAAKTRVGGDATAFAGYEASSAERAAYTSQEGGDVHVVILGHVDAGKSTLSGRLLYALKAVDDRAMHKNVRDSKASGKSSFAWAWVMDCRPEERERGVTIDVSMKRCVLDGHRQLVVLDAPGHKDFVPNAISGASQADAGVLVIDGAMGGFENGFAATPGHTGQTREHARLARALGLHSLIVVINKMDCVEYGEERFRFVVDALQNFLIDDVGFSQEQLTFVPVSGIEGTNISPDDAAALPDALASWYRGPTLVDALRAVKIPSRGAPKPLRMPIADIITEVRSLGGAACGGKIEAGSLMKGQKLLVMPANVSATVKCVEVDGIAVDFAPIGTSVDVGLSDVDSRHLEVGSVLCHASHPITPTDEIEVRVLTTDMLRVPLLKGSKVVLHSHMLACDATIEELVAQVDTVTGDVVKASPRCITREQSAILRIRTSRNICVEPVEISPTLSRVTLRINGKTMALGVVTAIWRS